MSEILKVKTIVAEHIKDREASVRGWVRSVRNSKAFSFLVINDGSCQESLQVVLDGSMEGYADAASLLTGSSVCVTGKLVESQGKGQNIEMQATKVEVIGRADDTYPIQKKGTSLEFLREVAHLRPRTNLFGAIFRIRHTLAFATHEFFNSQGFYYINTPIITGIDAEGAGEMFNVSTLGMDNPPRTDKGEVDYSKDYFGKSVNLTVSGQLEAECFACGMGSVYTFGPTFRSENSNTFRHLSEFWMIEPEVAFADLDDVADLATAYIKHLINAVLTRNPSDLAFLDSRREKGEEQVVPVLEHVLKSPFVKITYTEAMDICAKSGKKFEYPTIWGHELQTEHERFLTEEHFKAPVIVTDYPKDVKAFYMKQGPDGKTVRAMDVLVPGVGEIIGGSQREEDLERLQARMRDMHMNEEALKWYLDLRRFGTVPHAGFGLGFERFVMYVTGVKNIRDAIPFPRTPKNCEF